MQPGSSNRQDEVKEMDDQGHQYPEEGKAENVDKTRGNDGQDSRGKTDGRDADVAQDIPECAEGFDDPPDFSSGQQERGTYDEKHDVEREKGLRKL